MSKIIVLQHVAYEILGTFNAQLKQAGVRIKYVNFERHPHAKPTLEDYDGLVILGGPMSANDTDQLPHLNTEIELIQQALNRDLPTLGICLGSQLIAKAAQALVKKNPSKEIGWYCVTPTEHTQHDRLFKHLDSQQSIFQWHGDTFDLPKGAVHLATSEACANQAFRLHNHIYGLQFHLEVDEALIERWLTVPSNLEELAQLGDQISVSDIRHTTQKEIARNTMLSRQVFGEFINLLGHNDEPIKLRSR